MSNIILRNETIFPGQIICIILFSSFMLYSVSGYVAYCQHYHWLHSINDPIVSFI